jgi:hypothetical protein
MKMSVLQLFVPIVWMVIATIVGLVLYRTSKAVVRLKSIRVAGSAAIALVAFYGMYKATPLSLLASPYSERARVLQRDLADSLETLNGATKDCLAPGPELCRRALITLQSQLKRADADLESIFDLRAETVDGRSN